MRSRMRYLVPLLFVLMVVAGCGRQNAAPGPEPNETPMMENQNDMGMADEAARLAEQMNGVKSATAVMTGPSTLMVGLMLEEGISDEEAARIEEQVADELPERLDRVDRVLVTSNPDLVQRIEMIGRGVREGRPISEFADETQELLDRLMPRGSDQRA